MEFKQLMVADNDSLKICKSSDYNFIFDKRNGRFLRWGATKEDDPEYAPAPEIADIEISTSAKCSGRCKFCYKQNGPGQQEHNMTLDEFKVILDKLTQTKILTQIAFGICDIDTNPDFFPIMEHARVNGVIPNYTCNGNKVTQEVAERTAELCGAVAVSIVNKENSFDAIKRFTDAGMNQCNIHFMLSQETYDKAFQLVEEAATDERLSGLNAIVFLQYKPKGANKDSFHSVLDVSMYRRLIEHCEKHGVRYGFDSCSAPIFSQSIKGRPDEEIMESLAESCESTLFSIYINSRGSFFPCSFTEDEKGWEDGLDVANCDNFLEDIWYNDRTVAWRKGLLATTKDGHRHCPTFDLTEWRELER